MKIGFVFDDTLDNADGVQQYILALGNWMGSVGHEVHYLVGQTKRKDIPRIHSLSKNLHVKFNQNRMSIPLPANQTRIKSLLKREKFDVIHVQMPYSPMMAARVVKNAPKETAVIGTFHILPYSGLSSLGARILGAYLRRNLKRFDDFISVSKPAAGFAYKTFKIKSYVIPNTFDIATMRNGKVIKRYDDGKVNVVFLGRLVERKGCMQLLKALDLLNQKHRLGNVRVLICGKGELREELEKYAHDKKLGGVVHFVGFVTEQEKANYLATAQIAVFPSMGGESFGIVLVEAMAAGSEVVLGGNNPGYRSVLGERPKQLVKATNTKLFAASLQYYMSSTKPRETAYKWQQEAVKQYDVAVVGKNIIDIYKASVAKRSI